MLEAYVKVEGEDRRVPVRGALVVGRTRDCGLIIHDNAASRRHLEILHENGEFRWRDLGSTNGTLINGEALLSGLLKDGDKLQIGETVLGFNTEEVETLPGMKEDTRLFHKTIIDTAGTAEPAPEQGRAAALLEAVYAVTNEIASNYEACPLINRILETTMKAIDAQRGALYLAGQDNALMPCAECGHVHVIRDGKLGAALPGEIRISQTVAQRVLEHGESVLYQDTADDSSVSSSDSIMSLDLRSIICAPLRAKHGIRGILYIDSDRKGQHYDYDDMLLASAVGNSAGLALENAIMHRELLEKQLIEQDIATAWSIQEGFLEKNWPNDDPRFEVYGETRPARTVGGDFYDFVQPAPDRVGILIGDVSGKGFPAALTMAQLLAEFRIHARVMDAPVAVMDELNKDLVQRSQRGMFCTLCYITVDLTSGVVRCANAGHHPALRFGPNGVASWGGATGIPLGILPDAEWSETKGALAPGETLLLYTDGIVEAQSVRTRRQETARDKVEEFEQGRLEDAVRKAPKSDPRTTIAHVLELVDTFCAPAAPHDDRTMIGVRFLGD